MAAMPELVDSLLQAYSHLAARGYRDAGLLLAAALAYELADKAAFVRAALEAFEHERAFAGEDAAALDQVAQTLRALDADSHLRPEVETVEERLPSGAVGGDARDGARVAWEVADPAGRVVAASQPWPGTVEEALAEAAQTAVMLAVRRGWAGARRP